MIKWEYAGFLIGRLDLDGDSKVLHNYFFARSKKELNEVLFLDK